MKCSSELLNSKMKDFCNRNHIDEGVTWSILNNIYARDYGRNIMYEKNQHERENNLGDIPMCEYFGEIECVGNAIRVLDGMENCLRNGWGLE